MTADFDEKLSRLCELQKIDTNLHKNQRVLNSFPEELAPLQTAFNEVQGLLNAAASELGGIEKAKRIDESDLQVSAENLRQREARLYAIKTNKEYQAALKEVSEAKRQNKEREDRILQAMERIEELSKKITQLKQDTADKESALKAKQEDMAGREKTIRAQMEGDAARRPALVMLVEKELLRKYDFVRRRQIDVVVAVEGGTCQGCLRRIPPQLYNEILRREELKTCPNCQRLIYVVEKKPEEVPAQETI